MRVIVVESRTRHHSACEHCWCKPRYDDGVYIHKQVDLHAPGDIHMSVYSECQP